MLLLRFFHVENELFVGDKKYRATCPVRNEINHKRNSNQMVQTYPKNSTESRQYYYPRKFPCGVWEVKNPIVTNNPELAPVKIPTSAVRKVFIYDKNGSQYGDIIGVQDDSYYHLHFSKPYRTTLGCIRLHSEIEALDIANTIEKSLNKGEKVYIEVMVFKGE